MKTMKNLSVFFITVLLAVTTNGFAQNYWSFDNNEFSVQLKCVNNDKDVEEVSFAPITDQVFEWVVYKIVKKQKAKKAQGVGTLYTVRNAEGVEYTILYKKNTEVLIVIRTSDKTRYKLIKPKG
jgi:hypothetical protein